MNDPIPMRIICPRCCALHLDVGEFATKPHHTHSCQECGETWRPAVVHTVGVRFLPGFKNAEPEVILRASGIGDVLANQSPHAGQAVLADGGSEAEVDHLNDGRVKVDNVNHPPHYNKHPSGVECIVVVEHMTFNAGSAVKYLWRAGLKGVNNELEDVRKAQWYVTREIERLTKAAPDCGHCVG